MTTALRTAILCLALAGASLVSPTASPAGAAEPPTTCRGLPVTIQGAANSEITGTPGPDVIVAPYGTIGSVDAGEGDDVVCVVDGPEMAYPDVSSYGVIGGPGHDVVDATALPQGKDTLVVPAGPGQDAFYGGPEVDQVMVSFSGPQDVEADVISTGDGDDQVTSGAPGVPNGDRVDLGSGDDFVGWAGSGLAGEGFVDAGPGQDTLDFTALDPIDPPADPAPAGDLVFDNRTGLATLAEAPYAAWTGVEDFDLGDLKQHNLTFVGTAADESLTIGAKGMDVRMGAGDDHVSNGSFITPFPGGGVWGGPGQDLLDLDVDGPVRADLRGRVMTAVDGVRRVAALNGFEDVDAAGTAVWLRGSSFDNRLRASSPGDIVLVGGAGNDRLELRLWAGRPIAPGATRLARGGPGADRLAGSRLADVLRGGPGRDVAQGWAGRDFCVAEVLRGCELP